ncbi:glucokinase [Paucibacter sediminis]|uniref:Glucokinase n=1 Tax=Paucibacter sediminis TaxID=3019553 RepID=A0AA95NML3_9BURK|nr:glucokinase [Paucibacter sp. S2-9]WIT12566.1 glucokinase [Paucibacter sp. S2-9]
MIEIGKRAAAGARLLADVGGTNVRLGWQGGAGAAIEHVQTLACDAHRDLGHALQRYLQHLDEAGAARPTQAALGVATAVLDDQIRLTNRDWAFSAQALHRQLELQRLVVLNDFTALALAIPALPEPDFWHVGGPAAGAPGPLAVIGPGTGLGVSGLVPQGDRQWIALQTEGGHVGLAPQNEREAALLARLHQRFGRVSAERVLSGPGLANLRQAIAELDGQALPAPCEPAAVLQQALAGEPGSAEALALFCALLGDVAGDLVLSLGARGGVYIGGGIVPRLGAERFMRSDFRARFEAKGRLAGYMHEVPSYVIASQEPPALLGASRAL